MKIVETSFKRLLGIWKTTGTIKSNTGDQIITGTDSYESILDGNYILHKATVMMGDTPSETYELIHLDNAANAAILDFYNSSGESGKMKAVF